MCYYFASVKLVIKEMWTSKGNVFGTFCKEGTFLDMTVGLLSWAQPAKALVELQR